jgi:4a-hydroxytetrahydrobiopterin dehydratase
VNEAMLDLAQRHCVPGAPKLSTGELGAALTALDGWERIDDRLVKTFSFPEFHAVMAFVNALAYIAHREDHHPDLAVGFNRVQVSYSTHDAGGITLNDCICAARIDALDP